ncbi:MAG: GntR family transcriptional regulator [Bacillota bacterium]|nr:GntR family transcriptional regulator [Bacillota bacterium]
MKSLFTGIQFNDQDPIYLQLVVFFKTKIAAGLLLNGDEVPSRRAFAALLGINPMTVQKAYRLMEDEGFLATSANSGSFITLDDVKAAQIKSELCKGQVDAFIRTMQAMQMDFKSVIDLISTFWDQQLEGKTNVTK